MGRFSAGGDNKVHVKIAKYVPNVKCDSGQTSGPPWLSCASLFSNMRSNLHYRVFGPYNEEGVEDGLPLTLEAGKQYLRLLNPVFP